MQAVILAGGKGTRMGTLTDNLPKTLLQIDGTPLLGTIIENLPDCISEVIIVCRDQYAGIILETAHRYAAKRKITTVRQDEFMKGTYGSVHSAKDSIIEGSFLVLNSDDFIDKKSLTEATQYPFSMVFACEKPPLKNYLSFQVDKSGYVEDYKIADQTDTLALLYTGAMCIDQRLWLLDPVHVKSDEYGLPQTVLPIIAQAKAVTADHWQGFNTAEDLKNAKAMTY